MIRGCVKRACVERRKERNIAYELDVLVQKLRKFKLFGLFKTIFHRFYYASTLHAHTLHESELTHIRSTHILTHVPFPS